jgi:hypothetical protein
MQLERAIAQAPERLTKTERRRRARELARGATVTFHKSGRPTPSTNGRPE